jgi:CubicO group peptidase (beta-lactamase class C family)
LLLIERGKLALDDPIGKYVPNVPADKAPMTIRMILEGRSGLPNFHHLDSDPDPDLTPLSREAALKRILAMHLLFPPGTRVEHSHSAFGLLAAIVEIASGKSYQQFVRTEIFEPLGMKRTGFYGETLGLPETSFATGYGQRAVGSPNIPPKWGTTSWLVMGSGGMFSTLDDLVRYNDGIAKQTLFPGKPPRRMMAANVDGSERGFIFAHADNAQGDQIFLISNSEANRATNALVDQLSKLIIPR